MNKSSVFTWVLRIIPAAIFLMTVFFKFTGAPESVLLFETLGMEPGGRIGSGVVELIAAILILMPKTTWLGALIGLAVMTGAIFSHLTKLGINFQDDGGQLFGMGVVAFICCAVLLGMHRKSIPFLNN